MHNIFKKRLYILVKQNQLLGWSVEKSIKPNGNHLFMSYIFLKY